MILNGGKLANKEVISDAFLAASLCMGKLENDFEALGEDEFSEDNPLSVIVNVDVY